MKKDGLLFFIALTLQFPVHPQHNLTEAIFTKTVSFYNANPSRVEYVLRTHKNALKYDTSKSSFIFFPFSNSDFMLFSVDSSFDYAFGILKTDGYFLVDSLFDKKIAVKNSELKNTIYSWLNDIPAYNCKSVASMINAYGKIISASTKNNPLQFLTSKAMLEIDSATFRIVSVTMIANFQGKTQYNRYEYTELEKRVNKKIAAEAKYVLDVSKELPSTTFKKLDSEKPVSLKAEGQLFPLNNLVSYNKGSLDSVTKNKYVVFDFFYQACLPCYKMTNYILEWLPQVDTSKVVLVGINPVDSEESMKIYAQNRGLNYPIVLGEQARNIANKFVTNGYPTLLLMAPNRIILIKRNGMSKAFLQQALKEIQ